MNVRHIIPISGKDSLATAVVQTTRDPGLPYEYVYNDTTLELPETYEWLTKVELVLGVEIRRCGKNLEKVIAEQGVLPSPRMRYCTKYSKIFPMRDDIGKGHAVLYLGIRADEDRTGGFEQDNISIRYPLKELGVTLPMVYSIVDSKGLRPPTFFWKRLYDAVKVELCNLSHHADELPGWQFDRAFAWRSRPNCFMCFYQRRYEFVGLLEHHPSLYARAEELEARYGQSDATRERPFYWIKGLPLTELRKQARRLFAARVKAVARFIRGRAQGDLFAEALLDELDMAPTSCGVFCGK